MNVKSARLSWNIEGSQINNSTTAIIALNKNVFLLFLRSVLRFLGDYVIRNRVVLYESPREPNRIDVLLNASVQQQCFDNTKVFNSILTVR